MYLKRKRRHKDGKDHFYWNIVESRRCVGGKVVQRQVLYLGEINDGQRALWGRAIEAFDEATQRPTQLALFAADREMPTHAAGQGVQVQLDRMALHRPRQWGACWLVCHLYGQLELDRFWEARLVDSREGPRWRHILQTLVCTGCSIQVASGGCTGYGSSTARWAIFSTRIIFTVSFFLS